MNMWIKDHRMFNKAVAVALAFAFFVSTLAYDASAIVDINSSISGVTQAKTSSADFTRIDIDTFTIPAHLGEIKFSSKKETDKVIIHIQDAHCNQFAQHKISGIIDYLNKEYGINMVNLEGGVGPYDLDVFTSISGEAIRREVADYFVKKGEINGAEFYAINNPEAVTLWGIEQKDLYLANLKVYRDSLIYKEKADLFLKSLTHILNNLKRHLYSQELLKMDLEYSAYKAGNKEFREYMVFLLKHAKDNGVNIRSFPNLYLLFQAMEEENNIDFKKANVERNALVEELKKNSSKNDLRELVSWTVDFKTKKVSRKTFYNYLLGKAKELDVDIKKFPAFSTYIVYVALYEAVDRYKVMDEVSAMEDEIKELFYTSDDQRELNVLSKNLALTKNMFAITLTKSDYRYYLRNKSLFSTYNYTSFIEKESPKFKITARLVEGIEELDSYLEDITKFYEYSFKRDEVFVENLRFSTGHGTRGTGHGSQSAILMTGGFHTENLCELLGDNGISYVSILPKFTSEDGYESPYFDLLAGQTTNVQSMMASVLAKASMMQVASMLSSLGEEVWGKDEVAAFNATVRLMALKGTDFIARIEDIGYENGKIIFYGKENKAMYEVKPVELLKAKTDQRPDTITDKKEIVLEDAEKILDEAFDFATRDPSTKGADLTKYATHEAMRAVEAGKEIVAVTIEPSSLRELNENWTHSIVDEVRDTLGENIHAYFQGINLGIVGVRPISLYTPYGIRWQYLFEAGEEYDENVFKTALEGMLETVIPKTRERAKNLLEESFGKSIEENDILVQAFYANVAVSKVFGKKRERLLDVLHSTGRALDDTDDKTGRDKVRDWINLIEKSPPSALEDNIKSVMEGMFSNEAYSGMVKEILTISENGDIAAGFKTWSTRKGDSEEYRRMVERVRSSSNSVIDFVEIKYFAEKFKAGVARSERKIGEEQTIFNTKVPEGLKNVFAHNEEDVDEWISDPANKERMKITRIERFVPNYTALARKKEDLNRRIGAGENTPELNAEIKSFVEECVKLNVESEAGGLKGRNVISTFAERFLGEVQDAGSGVLFRVNIDFDNLSKAPVQMGDHLKDEGLKMITGYFRDEFSGTAIFVQKGKGDESVVIGRHDGSAEEIEKILSSVVRDINEKLSGMMYEGKKIEFDIPGQESKQKPAISGGISVLTFEEMEGKSGEEILSLVRQMDDKAEKANAFAKRKGRGFAKIYGDDVQEFIGGEIGEITLGPGIPEKLVPFAAGIELLNPYLSAEEGLKGVAEGYYAFLNRFSQKFDYTNLYEKTRMILNMGNWFGTNENDWADSLGEMEGKEGVYVGVSYGGQNLSRLCHGNFDSALIVDINPFVTEVFMPMRNELILRSANRAEYLGLLAGIRLSPDEIEKLSEASLEDIHNVIINKIRSGSKEDRAKNMATLWNEIKGIFPQEIRSEAKGFWDRYSPRYFGLGNMVEQMKKTDEKYQIEKAEESAKISGKTIDLDEIKIRGSWLADEQNFSKIKGMVKKGKIRGITGSILSEDINDALEQELADQGLNISVLYLSNLMEWSGKSIGNINVEHDLTLIVNNLGITSVKDITGIADNGIIEGLSEKGIQPEFAIGESEIDTDTAHKEGVRNAQTLPNVSKEKILSDQELEAIFKQAELNGHVFEVNNITIEYAQSVIDRIYNNRILLNPEEEEGTDEEKRQRKKQREEIKPIDSVKVVTTDMDDTIEAQGYMDGDTLIIVMNNKNGRDADYLSDKEVFAHLIMHEFLEANGYVHRDLKYLEMVDNYGNGGDMTPLNRMAIKHMTLDQLLDIQLKHSLDPEGVFYRAVQVEIVNKYTEKEVAVVMGDKLADSIMQNAKNLKGAAYETFPKRVSASQSVIGEIVPEGGTVVEIGLGGSGAPTFRELKSALEGKAKLRGIEYVEKNIPEDLAPDIVQGNIFNIGVDEKVTALIEGADIIRVSNLMIPYFYPGRRKQVLQSMEKHMKLGARLIITHTPSLSAIKLPGEEGFIFEMTTKGLERKRLIYTVIASSETNNIHYGGSPAFSVFSPSFGPEESLVLGPMRHDGEFFEFSRRFLREQNTNKTLERELNREMPMVIAKGLRADGYNADQVGEMISLDITGKMPKNLKITEWMMARFDPTPPKVTESVSEAELVARSRDDMVPTVGITSKEDIDPAAIEKAELELLAEADKNVLSEIKAGTYPSIVLLEVSEDQLLFDGSKYTKLKNDTRRTVVRKYGINTAVIFYTNTEDSMKGIGATVEGIKGFDHPKARVIAFCSNETEGVLKGTMTGEEFEGKVSGFVRGDFVSENDLERFSLVSLTVLGLGLMDLNRAYEDGKKVEGLETSIKVLLSGLMDNYEDMEDYIEKECNNDVSLFIKAVLSGDFLMKIKKVNYEEIRNFMDAESAVLESL